MIELYKENGNLTVVKDGKKCGGELICSLTDDEINMLFNEYFGEKKELEVSLMDVLGVVLDVCSITYEEFHSKCRDRRITIARQLFSYVASQKYPVFTLKQIGGVMGKSYSDVIHNRDKIINYISINDQTVCKLVDRIVERCEKL